MLSPDMNTDVDSIAGWEVAPLGTPGGCEHAKIKISLAPKDYSQKFYLPVQYKT